MPTPRRTDPSPTLEEFRVLARHAGLALGEAELAEAYRAYCEFFLADILPRVRRAAEPAP